MPWKTPITSDYLLNFAVGATAISVNPSILSSKLPKLYYESNTVKRLTNTKSQLLKVKIRNLTSSSTVNITTGMSFSMMTNYGDKLTVNPLSLSASHIPTSAKYLYLYSEPTTSYTGKVLGVFEANDTFISPLGIEDFTFYQINWSVNGFMSSDDGTTVFSSGGTSHGLGWKFIEGTSSGFIWYDATASISTNYPVGGAVSSNDSPSLKSSSDDFRGFNFITRFVPYQFYNLYFDYNKISGNDNDGIRIYISDEKPFYGSTSWQGSALLVATISRDISDPINADFYSLQGGGYLTIVGDKSSSTTQSLIISLSDIKIEGGYHSENNELFSVSLPSYTIGITGATFTSFVGNGNTINSTQSLSISQIESKIGNGRFNSGIWETGVWNSGWRDDENVKEFDDADISFRSISDVRWRIRIIGPSSSVSYFSVGDKVSIGNIVAIDINEKRNLLKGSFTILNVSETGLDDRRGFIVVEVDTTFPIRRIEKDSKNHRIKITKNIWLNGAFLNGYFTGVWNNGLLKGYPLTTQLENTNWIDGIFDGGHFRSELSVTASFIDTLWIDGKVGLTFSTPHKLILGDTILVDKNDKTINPQYDGETTVVSILNDYSIVTNLDWGINSTNESGLITTKIATGLIQNFKFYDNNISKVTSNSSLNSSVVFIYNSWIDVNYENISSVNIGKPQNLINDISNRSYSENNLYGYPTYEVLSSESQFRDSFSSVKRKYSLGTKYTTFNDFIGDSSSFDEFFGPTGSNLQLFYDQGWTYSSAGPNSITFSRTIGNEYGDLEGKELLVDAISEGGVLDLSTPNIIVNNRENSDIPKNRYTIVEFDLITYSVNSTTYQEEQYPWGPSKGFSGFKGDNIVEPIIHFNNLNYTPIKTSTIFFGTIDIIYSSTYLPIYENINHLLTPNRKKVEYFYNKRNLGMHFKGSGLYGSSQSQFVIDNLKLLEVDMIPFFQYFTEDNINFGVEIPYQGIAPYIDYSDTNFQFIDNINLGLDSLIIVSSDTAVSGVGPGIGSITTTGDIFISEATSATDAERGG